MQMTCNTLASFISFASQDRLAKEKYEKNTISYCRRQLITEMKEKGKKTKQDHLKKDRLKSGYLYWSRQLFHSPTYYEQNEAIVVGEREGGELEGPRISLRSIQST